MHIGFDMIVRKKNIPPQNRGEMRQSRWGLPRYAGVGSSWLGLIFPGAARIAAPEML